MSLTDINALLNVKGYAFDDKDLSAIQTSLTKSETEFEEVSKLKADLETRLQETSARFAHLKGAIADYKTALRCNPIRVLIPEILSYIFLEYCGIHSGQLPSYLTSHDLASAFHDISCRRNVLLSVCRRWRAITLTTPRLWAAIDMSGPYVYSARTHLYPHDSATRLIPPNVIDKHWQRIDQAIERAGSVPLSIVQNVGGHPYLLDLAFRNKEVSAMLQKLVEVLPRTQEVNLQFAPFETITLPALADHPSFWPHNPMPYLKTFHVSSQYAVDDMSQWMRHFLRQVPPKQLVDVKLSFFGDDGLFMENILRMTHSQEHAPS
ncbi:hypothetical protein BDZ89DRAFT_1045988 [Hymenopellis radicata]|nr:hypothetical protein BDZ89DRAFT_1045988 [Hymenopellis radicata]